MYTEFFKIWIRFGVDNVIVIGLCTVLCVNMSPLRSVLRKNVFSPQRSLLPSPRRFEALQPGEIIIQRVNSSLGINESSFYGVKW